jgi:hypothetical protein
MSFDQLASKRRSTSSSSSSKKRSEQTSSSVESGEACALKLEPVDVGPALLLVVHLPGLGALISSTTLPYIFLVAGATENLELVKSLTLGLCIFGIVLAVVVLALINNTWHENKRVARCQRTTFGTGSFLALAFVCVAMGAFNIWMIPLIYMKTL